MKIHNFASDYAYQQKQKAMENETPANEPEIKVEEPANEPEVKVEEPNHQEEAVDAGNQVQGEGEGNLAESEDSEEKPEESHAQENGKKKKK